MVIVRKPYERPLRRLRAERLLKELEALQDLKEPVFKTNGLTGEKYGYGM